MPLDQDFRDALTRLGRVFARYQAASGDQAVLVGGTTVSLYTNGLILSGDFDVVANADAAFETAMRAQGFVREHRAGRLRIGWYHPDCPLYGFQAVSGALFDGRADRARLVTIITDATGCVLLPSIEDMIADRLGQFAASDGKDQRMLDQAVLLKQLAGAADLAYLRRRVVEETGDPSLIGL